MIASQKQIAFGSVFLSANEVLLRGEGFRLRWEFIKTYEDEIKTYEDEIYDKDAYWTNSTIEEHVIDAQEELIWQLDDRKVLDENNKFPTDVEFADLLEDLQATEKTQEKDLFSIKDIDNFNNVGPWNVRAHWTFLDQKKTMEGQNMVFKFEIESFSDIDNSKGQRILSSKDNKLIVKPNGDYYFEFGTWAPSYCEEFRGFVPVLSESKDQSVVPCCDKGTFFMCFLCFGVCALFCGVVVATGGGQ